MINSFAKNYTHQRLHLKPKYLNNLPIIIVPFLIPFSFDSFLLYFFADILFNA
jgi:hypothetical protein